MYTVVDYGSMASDGCRIDAYARAIARVVKPESCVLDIGAGTGILSLLAARAGARRVHAVETNPAIHLLPEIARENGLADRIVIHPQSLFEVVLDEKVDVIVSDLRGSSPLNGDNLEAMRDARSRFLVSGGHMLPARDRLFFGVVESHAIERRLVYADDGFALQRFKGHAARVSARNSVYRDCDLSSLNANDLFSTAECWATIDYGAAQQSVVEGEGHLIAKRSGMAHGLAVWFEATIHEELGFSNPPGHQGVYARTFLPLLDPIKLEAGDRIHVVLRADERGERWGWDTTIEDARGAQRVKYRQSTFLGTPTSPQILLRASSSFKPTRSDRGERYARLLAAMDGSRTSQELEALALTSAPPGMPRSVIIDEVKQAISRHSR